MSLPVITSTNKTIMEDESKRKWSEDNEGISTERTYSCDYGETLDSLDLLTGSELPDAEGYLIQQSQMVHPEGEMRWIILSVGRKLHEFS